MCQSAPGDNYKNVDYILAYSNKTYLNINFALNLDLK